MRGLWPGEWSSLLRGKLLLQLAQSARGDQEQPHLLWEPAWSVPADRELCSKEWSWNQSEQREVLQVAPREAWEAGFHRSEELAEPQEVQAWKVLEALPER